MTEEHKDAPRKGNFFYNLEKSFVITFIGVVLLFSCSVAVVLVAPAFIDPTWTSPTSPYQVQMYEVSDPNVYISSTTKGVSDMQFVYHIKNDYTLLAFKESEAVRIVAPRELQKYITKKEDKVLKLTSELLLLRVPEPAKDGAAFDGQAEAGKLRKEMQARWEIDNPRWKEEQLAKPGWDILELYRPQGQEAFALGPVGSIENWVDSDYVILDKETMQPWHNDPGVIFVNNPKEYLILEVKAYGVSGWRYDPKGSKIRSLEALKSHPLGFISRAELIKMGEHIFAIEGCWYCHTDQTRTLVQDVVLNGSASYPAPPSCANEYIYQKITFPGTRRIGPDLSRVGIKRPSRDWHKGHFWSPKTASRGSIMPSFKHFFDNDPRGTAVNLTGVPNYQFEAVFQYLMTKGTRITPPTQAWWLGMDPINTLDIIEGRKKAP